MTTLHDSILENPPAERKSIGIEQTEAASSSGPSSLAPESLSSASSFQSLSSKSSSGICTDSAPGSPDKTVLLNSSGADAFDHSYVNVDIPDLDDIISACANINLGAPRAQRRDEQDSSPDSTADLSHDQTFASATDDNTVDEVTQLLVEDTAIQAFETCPELKTQVAEASKAPLPVEQSSSSTTGGDSTSSVAPSVPLEDSVLRNNQGEEKQVAVADSLKVDALKTFKCSSPTPSEEADVAQSATPKSDNSFASAEDGIGQKLETADGFNTPDVSFQEVQTFNSAAIPLNTDDNKSAQNTPENFNLTAFVSACDTIVQSQKDITASNDVVASEEVEAARETNVLNKTQDIITESNLLNKTQEIVEKNNLFNKTQDIVEENNLNKTQEIVKKNKSLNKTQEIVEQENLSNKTRDIAKENNLNKNQEIVKENGSLNKTQEIVETENVLNKTQEIIKAEKLLNKNPKFDEERSCINKAQEVVKEENLFNSQEIAKESPLNRTQDIISDANVVNKAENILAIKQEKTSPSTVESASLNKNTFEDFKEPFLTVKSPSRLYENKDSNTPPNSEFFDYDDSHNSNAVVASTPLHWKKDEKQRTPKRKSALFNQEANSAPQSPSLANQALNKSFNSPSKDKATKEQENKVNFDQTIALNKSFEKSPSTASELISKNDSFDLLPTQEPDYEAFVPQQQSTTLPFSVQCPNFEVLQEAALSVAKDIDESLEKIEEEQFVPATAELFGDPSAFDFLTQHGTQSSHRDDRYDSFYMKFDPLAQRQSMLPQKNLPATPAFKEEEEQRDTKVDTSISNAGTPRKNPAIAAIDRLLFYSPCPPATTDSEKVEAKQKKEEAEKKEPQSVPVVNEEMAKELELVRSTVLQLEAELEKQRQEHEKRLEKQRVAYDDKVMQIQAKFGQMQSQLSQETKCKDQMTVVVEEYEKSISRLIAEREKEKQIFTQERDRIKAELEISQQHLANSEAAFTDVHSKYERLKSVVTAYKSNEEVLKESITENQETIKTLENRYEQLKSHAMAQLEKANLELSAIKKQHEAEVLKLKAMVRKTELRCKTLDETVEQKTKENKELTQIIDEMIARVD